MSDRIAKRFTSERGIALVVTLIALVVVLVLGLAVLQNSVSGLRTSGNDRQLKSVVALAEAGVEYTRETIRTKLRAGQTLNQLLGQAANGGALVDSTTLAGFGGTTAITNGTTNTPIVAPRAFGSGNFQVFLTNDMLEGGAPSASVAKVADSNGRIMVTSFAGKSGSLAAAQAQLALYENLQPGVHLPALITMPGPDVNFQSFASNARLVYGYAPGELAKQANDRQCFPTIAVSTNYAKAKIDAIMCTPGNCSSGQYTSCRSSDVRDFGGSYSCPTNGPGGGNRDNDKAYNPSTENFFATAESVSNPYDSYAYGTNGERFSSPNPRPGLAGNRCLTKVSYLSKLRDDVSTAAVAGCNSTVRSCTSPYGTPDSPQITFINGDLTMRGNESGAGILLVTGKLTFSGTPTYEGIILVIGQGNFEHNGAGNGKINGAMLIANINTPWPPDCHCAPQDSCEDTLEKSYSSDECKCYAGVPTYNINGGGNSEFSYDPDAISWKAAALMPLDVISFRLMH